MTLLFFWLQNLELAKALVKMRVSGGGHNIEPEIIETRYFRGIKNLVIGWRPRQLTMYPDCTLKSRSFKK